MSNPEPTAKEDNSATSTARILTDQPRYSSAALCISLQVDGIASSFRPEYTHQCVGISEVFPGYRPPQSVLMEALQEVQKHSNSSREENDDNMLYLHKSHASHTTTDQELRIQVSLASSCKFCKVTVHIQPYTLDTTDDPPTKRVRIQTENEEWSQTKILQALQKALPPMVESDETDKNFLTKPIGIVLEEYSRDKHEQQNFVIAVADGQTPGVADYHGRVQPLALLYIENADNVDVTNTDNGYWKVFYVFQKHSASQYSLVGYFSLFHFIALFHKPEPGIIVRICQALVLPPYQGQGHGERMMQAVYRLAHDMQKVRSGEDGTTAIPHEIVQVNVEDPAPAFVALRNKTDFNMVKEHGKKWDWPAIVDNDKGAKMDASFFAGLPESKAVELAAKAKITPHQVHIVNDLIKREALDAALSNDSLQLNREESERLFRLMVKKRLNKEHREELGGFGSKDKQKAYLAELFDKHLDAYNRILKRK